MKRLVVALALSALLLAGCTGSDLTRPEPTATATPLAIDSIDSIDPTGLWRVSHAEGAGEDTWLYLADDLVLWSDCGIAEGNWNARGATFVAQLFLFLKHSCNPDTFIEDSAWLYQATNLRETNDGIELLDSDGAVVASLTVDGYPPSGGEERYTHQPTPSRSAEIVLDVPNAATMSSQLIGRWVHPDVPDDGTYIEFFEDGFWRGSDGCNTTAGRWALGEYGIVITGSGISTLVGCSGSNVARLSEQATAVAVTSTGLTFYGPEGVLQSVIPG